MPAPGELPKHAQEIWGAAYAAAQKQYPNDTAKQHAVAWAAVEKAGYEKKGDKWVKVQESEPVFERLGDLVLACGTESAVGLVRGDKFTLLGTPENEERFALMVVEDDKNKPDDDEYHIVIATAGRNENKKRWYLNEAFESLPERGFYDGLQMHLDHAGKEGEPVGIRSVRTFASLVRESWRVSAKEAPDGVARYDAIIRVFPNAGPFRESLRDPLFRKAVFVSHVADLSGYIGREAGSTKKSSAWQCITKIDRVYGVDWVTRPGARGRVAESDETKTTWSVEENDMDIDKLTLSELRAGNPALVKAIEDAVTAPLQERLTALETAASESATERRKERISAAVKEAVKDKAYGIPETAQEAIAERATGNVFALKSEETDGDKMASAVKTILTAEAELVAKIQGKAKVALESGATVPDKNQKRNEAQALADRLA